MSTTTTTWQDYADQLTTEGDGQCQITNCVRPSRFDVKSHGCERLMMCTEHVADWFARVSRILRIDGRAMCELCGVWFHDIRDITRATAL